MPEAVEGKSTWRALAPGVSWIVASPLLVLLTVILEQRIRRWLDPDFFHSGGDLVLGLCGFAGAFLSILVGMVLVLKAPVPWAFRIAIVVLPLFFIWRLLTAFWGMLL